MTHPTVADLVERSGDDAVRAHLATCPPCRARAALLADLDGSDPGPLALELARHRAVSSLSPEPDDGALAPGAVVDRWVVEARLGAGGMGTVYRVRHQHLGSLAALKVLHRRVDHALQEGRAQGRLTHPHVVGVTDVVEVQGGPALVMELVPGPTLAEHLRAARGPLPAAEVDEIARGVLRGVAAAHRAGLVHRDLKPGNVLLARAGDRWVAKVADFGLARGPQDDSMPAGPVGTPAYTAPELLGDAPRADARSDVFSLGALLYELVTGARAFAGASVEQVHDAIRRGDRPATAAVPARWRPVLERAWAADPARRYADADALLAAWEQAGEPAAPAAPRVWWVVGAAVVGVVGVAAAAVARERARPPPPADEPQVERRVTARPGDQQLFGIGLSPDGQEVAYGDARGLHRQRVDGGEPVVVVGEGPFHDVDWFPDGEHLLAHGTWGGTEGVWRVGVDGRGRELLASGMLAVARLAPGGDRFAAVDAAGLWVQGVGGGPRRQVRAADRATTTAALAWSPDGDHLATITHSAEGSRLEVIAVATGEVRRLSSEPGLVTMSLASLVWLPPDRLQYVVSGETRRRMVLDGASVATTADDAVVAQEWSGYDVTHTSATPDGARVATARITAQTVPMVVDLAGGAARRLGSEEWDQTPLAWPAPDTVWVQSSRGAGEVVALPLGDGAPRRVSEGGWTLRRADRVGEGWVSLRVADERGPVEVVRDGPDGRRVLATLPTGGVSKAWALRCRAERCLLSEQVAAGVATWWLDPATGDREPTGQAPLPDGAGWDLHPDGRHLAVASATARLQVLDLDGGPATPWPLALHTPMEVSYSADGEALYVSGLTWQADAYRVDEVRRDGSRVVWASPSWYLYRPTPSPDGRFLAFSAVQFDDDVWLSERPR